MPRLLLRCAVAVALLVVGIAAGLAASVPLFARPQAGHAAPAPGFAAIEPIDTHMHAFKAVPALTDLFSRLHLRALNILLIDDRDPFAKSMEPQWTNALAVHRLTKGRAAVCTTIDPYDFETPGFVARVNNRLECRLRRRRDRGEAVQGRGDGGQEEGRDLRAAR